MPAVEARTGGRYPRVSVTLGGRPRTTAADMWRVLDDSLGAAPALDGDGGLNESYARVVNCTARRNDFGALA